METEKEYQERMQQMVAKRIEDNKHKYGIVKLEKVRRDPFRGWYYDTIEILPNTKYCQCNHPRPNSARMCMRPCGNDEDYLEKIIIDGDKVVQASLKIEYDKQNDRK